MDYSEKDVPTNMLRNKNKKLDGIKELDAKIKNGDVEPDEAQKLSVGGVRCATTLCTAGRILADCNARQLWVGA